MDPVTKRPILLCSALFSLLSGCGSGVEHYNVAFDISPNGKEIVFSSAGGDLYLFNLQSKKVETLTRSEVIESRPMFSPDGKSIVYSSSVAGQDGEALYVMNLENCAARRLTNAASVTDHSPSFSADGKWITFVRATRYRQRSMGGMTWSDHDVHVINTDGSGLKRLTNEKYYGVSAPQFTHDAKEVIYSADVPCDTEFFKKDMGGSITTLEAISVTSGSSPRHVLRIPQGWYKGGALGSEPSLSADGKRITFISDKAKPFDYDVITMNKDGTDIRPLNITNISRYNQQPKFMPDGKSILFLSGTETNGGSRAIYSLYQVDVDGKNARKVADSELFTHPETWKPKP